MGIFSKIKEITKSSHFSICKIEESEIAIDLWDLNQTYIIDLNNNNIYFDTVHSDTCDDFKFIQIRIILYNVQRRYACSN